MATKERTLASVIEDAMTAKGYGSRTLGDMLGVSKSTVNFWRQGKHPDPFRFEHIATVLDLDADELWSMYETEVRAVAPPLESVRHKREEVVALLYRCAAVTRRRSSVCAPGIAVA